MRRLRAVVLDFDGVLVESTRIKDEAFRRVFSAFPGHAEKAFAFHRRHLTHSRYEKLRYLVEDLLGRTGDRGLVEKLASEFSRLVSQQIVEAPEVPGASEFFRRFSDRVEIFVASVTPQMELEELLRARGWAPHVIQAYGDPPTPKSDAIRRALAEAGCRPDEAIMIGDAPSDLAAAHANGVAFLGRDGGIPFLDAETRLYADLHEIARVVDERCGGPSYG